MIVSSVGARILGCLVEKQLTTPQQYPLTANALQLACNQASNRDPVVSYSEGEISNGLDELRQKQLVRFVLPSHGRSVVRYRHVINEALELDRAELALLAVLVLRGAQTAGELRARTGRLAELDSVDDVEHVLAGLSTRDEPLVRRIDRRPGQKEDRWTDLLQGVPGSPEHSLGGWAVSELEERVRIGESDREASRSTTGTDGVSRDELEELRAEVNELRAAIEDLRSSLGG
jgi:uncharacterized protein YceH (UPF0502 family)